MPISDANLAPQSVCRAASDPMGVGRDELPVVELGLVTHDDLGRIGHDPKDVPGAAPSKAEPAPLTAGEVGHALVTAQHGSSGIDDVARDRGGPLAVDEVADTAVGHETQLHGFRLVRIWDAQTPAGFADLRLGELTEREDERFERRLRQPKEEVALIFLVVPAA